MSFGGISSSHVYLDIFPCSLVRVLKCSFWGQAKPSLNFLHKMKSPAAGTYGWCRIRVAATACCSPNHWHFNWSPFITGLQSDLTVNEPFHDCDLNYLLLLSKYVEMENKNPNPKHWNLSKRLSRRLCAALFLLSGKRISTPGFQTSGDISNSLSFNLHHWLTQAVSRGTVSGHEQGRMEPSLAAHKTLLCSLHLLLFPSTTFPWPHTSQARLTEGLSCSTGRAAPASPSRRAFPDSLTLLSDGFCSGLVNGN